MTEVRDYAAPDAGAAWQPGEDVTNHAGGTIEADADFFTPPPPEIGEIVSAQTSLRRNVSWRW